MLLNRDNYLLNKASFIRADLYYLNRLNFYNKEYYSKIEIDSINKRVEEDLFSLLEDLKLSELEFLESFSDYKEAIEQKEQNINIEN